MSQINAEFVDNHKNIQSRRKQSELVTIRRLSFQDIDSNEKDDYGNVCAQC